MVKVAGPMAKLAIPAPIVSDLVIVQVQHLQRVEVVIMVVAVVVLMSFWF